MKDEHYLSQITSLVRMAKNALEEAYDLFDRIENPEIREEAEIELEKV